MEKMDQTDIKILECLKKNARAKASSIAEEINLSVSAVTERIKKLESSGIIQGYAVLVDQKKIGNSVSAIMMVDLLNIKYCDEFENLVKSIDNIVSCHYVTGDCDYALKIITDSTDSLELIHRRIKGFAGINSTKTLVVLRSPKSESTLMPKEI